MTKLAFVLDNGRELQIPLAADMPLGRLAEVTAAVQDVEMQHQERMKSLGVLSARHERASSDLANVNARYNEVSGEVNRLQAIEAELLYELQTLAARKDQSLNALQELSGRRAVEENHLRSLEERTAAASRLLDETTDAAETAQAGLRTLLDDLAQAGERQEQLHAEIVVRAEELSQAEAKLHEVQALHECVEGRRNVLVAACEDLALGNGQLQLIQTEIEASIASLTLQEQVARLAASAAETARQDAAESLRQKEAELNAYQTDLKQLEAKTVVAREELARTEECQSRLSQVLGSQQERQKRLQDSICSLESLLAERQAVLAATEKAHAVAERQRAETQETLSSMQRSLDEHEEQLKRRSAELEDKNRKITTRSEELAGLSAMLERRHYEERESAARLSNLASQIETSQQRLGDVSEKLEATQDEHSRLADEISVHQSTIVAQQKQLDAVRQEQAEAENRVAGLSEQEDATRSSIDKLAAAEKVQKERYDELHSLTAAAESVHADRLKAHENRLAHASQELLEVENRLEALEAWNQRMIECQALRAALPPDSLEARNLQNDIEVSMAGLRHLLSKHAHPVAPPPLAMNVEARPSQESGRTAPAGVRGESPPQERGGKNLRARMQSQAGSSMREQDRHLEDKIRQNEARLELLERRLKRGELEERHQREKIAILKLQLGEVANEISNKVLVRA